MKRFLATLAIAALAAFVYVSATASAATSGKKVQKNPYEADPTLCNGDTVHLSGTLLEFLTLTRTPSGGTIIVAHSNSQGISGVDTTTGTRYRLISVTHDAGLFPPSGVSMFTYSDRVRLQATAGAESFIFIRTMHLTVTPNGRVTADITKYAATC